MTYFAYRVVGKTEYNGFDVPQTPQSFADDTEQRLTDPDFLEGDKRFALVVWALPEGVNHVDDVPQDSVAHGNYIQCAGSTHAMTVEIRVDCRRWLVRTVHGGPQTCDRPRCVDNHHMGW